MKNWCFYQISFTLSEGESEVFIKFSNHAQIHIFFTFAVVGDGK